MLPVFFSNASQKRDKKAGAIWTAVSRPQGKCLDGTHHLALHPKAVAFASHTWLGEKIDERD
jgi:hypothetical protein